MFELARKRLLGKIRTLLRQPRFTLVWIFPVWVALGICRIAILAIPLRLLHRWYGRDGALDTQTQPLSLSKRSRARQIRDVVALASRNTPWWSQCYPQALVAHLVLAFYNIPHVLYFGLRKSDSEAEPYKAHAWIVAGEIVVSGGPHHRTFKVVRAFITGSIGGEVEGFTSNDERRPGLEARVSTSYSGQGDPGSEQIETGPLVGGRSQSSLSFSTSRPVVCVTEAPKNLPKVE